ncbi:hypothetical protein J2746_000165 [Methanolobus bombayensis]|nr:hypothetical protein [Methanolobus bombayensis]
MLTILMLLKFSGINCLMIPDVSYGFDYWVLDVWFEYFHLACLLLIYTDDNLVSEVNYMDEYFENLVERANYYEQFEEVVRYYK